MILRDIDFFIREAFIGMKRSSLMSIISMCTISISLIIFGFFLIMSVNMNHLASFISSKLEIRVFLHPSATKLDIQTLQSNIQKNENIKSIYFEPKETAWTTFKKNYPNLSLDNLITKNPLPDSLRIQLKTPTTLP